MITRKHKRMWSSKKVFENSYVVIQTLQCTADFTLFPVSTYFWYFFDSKKTYQLCLQWDVAFTQGTSWCFSLFLPQKLPVDFLEARCTVSIVLVLPNTTLQYISTGPREPLRLSVATSVLGTWLSRLGVMGKPFSQSQQLQRADRKGGIVCCRRYVLSFHQSC